MGVDSYGLVIVGQPETDVQWGSMLEMTDTQKEYLDWNHCDDAICDWTIKHREMLGGLELECVYSESWSVGIVGFVVAKSPSYGFAKSRKLTLDIAVASTMYQTIFQQKPNIYVASLSEE